MSEAERADRSSEEVRELVSLATLGEGVLRESDEHRILKVLLTAGFSPLEAREKVDAALAALGARRTGSERLPPAEPPPEGGEGKAATPEVVAKAITRSFQRPTRRTSELPLSSSSDEVVVAELVRPPLLEPPSADDTARWSGVCSSCLAEISTEDVRSGRAEVQPSGKRHCRACLSKLRAGLLCKVCYEPIERAALLDGRAQLHADRAVHGSCLQA